jgi:hypothetical protein
MPANTELLSTEGDSSNGPKRRAGARKRNVIEIVSSERASDSPVPGQYEEQGQFNYVDDEVDDDYEPYEPATPVSGFAHSGSKERTDLTSLTKQLPMSEQILRLKTVLELDHATRKKDIERGRKRAPNGLLLTKDGKVDRRSLRLFNCLGNEENQTPNRSSLAPENDQAGGQEVSDQQSSGRFKIPVLPSVEQVEFSLETRSTPQSLFSSSNLAITPRDPRPFKCGSCNKEYVARAGLRYVSSSLSRFLKGLTNDLTASRDCKK